MSYGERIHGTAEDVKNACLKDDKQCKAYAYSVDEGYGKLCSSSNLAVYIEDEGSGDNDTYSGSYQGFQVCIRNTGKFQLLHFMHIFLKLFHCSI